MSNLVKLALLVAIAAITIGAIQIVMPAYTQVSSDAVLSHVSVSPDEITRAAGPLPELKIENYQ